MIVPTLVLARTQDQYARHISQKTQASFDRLRMEMQRRKAEMEEQRSAMQQGQRQGVGASIRVGEQQYEHERREFQQQRHFQNQHQQGEDHPHQESACAPDTQRLPPTHSVLTAELVPGTSASSQISKRKLGNETPDHSHSWSAVSQVHGYQGVGPTGLEPRGMLGTGSGGMVIRDAMEESSELLDGNDSETSEASHQSATMATPYVEMQNAFVIRNRISKTTNARRRKVNDASALALKAHLEKKLKDKAADSEQLSRLKDLDVAP